MELIATMNDKNSQFFSHRDSKMVEWFANIVEERKINHVTAKERKKYYYFSTILTNLIIQVDYGKYYIRENHI